MNERQTSAPLSEERLQEIGERANRATLGPWESDGRIVSFLLGQSPAVAVRYHVDQFRLDPVCLCQPDGSGRYGMAGSPRPIEDAAFIAAARADIPDLLAEIRRLRGIIQQLGAGGILPS